MTVDLEGYGTSKGTVRFSPDEPLPAALVERLVLARLEELGTGRGRRPPGRDALIGLRPPYACR
jgi:hypothetical protein